jgi:hypothetical protein
MTYSETPYLLDHPDGDVILLSEDFVRDMLLELFPQPRK